MFIMISFQNYITIAQDISPKLEIGSLVQFGNPIQYGVIYKMVETSVDTLMAPTVATVETVSYIHGNYTRTVRYI